MLLICVGTKTTYSIVFLGVRKGGGGALAYHTDNLFCHVLESIIEATYTKDDMIL